MALSAGFKESGLTSERYKLYRAISIIIINCVINIMCMADSTAAVVQWVSDFFSFKISTIRYPVVDDLWLIF